MMVPTPQPPSTVVNLSDLDWTSVSNGLGVPELDQSNGGAATNDGGTLTLNGVSYTKGIGVHSNSEIHYDLNGLYSIFSADIGVDDSVGRKGSVVFQVWADGVKLYESGTMDGGDATKSVVVNVSGRNELVLIVTDASDGKANDNADWANAKLTLAPTLVGDANSTFLGLSQASDQTDKYGPIELNQSVGSDDANDGTTLSIGGKTFSKGIGTHSYSRLEYNVDGKYQAFVAEIGVDDDSGKNGSVTFEVWGDGVKLYDSGKVTGKMAAKTCVVPVAGKKQIWLVVTDADDGTKYDAADWANARLVGIIHFFLVTHKCGGGHLDPAALFIHLFRIFRSLYTLTP